MANYWEEESITFGYYTGLVVASLHRCMYKEDTTSLIHDKLCYLIYLIPMVRISSRSKIHSSSFSIGLYSFSSIEGFGYYGDVVFSEYRLLLMPLSVLI